MTSERQIAANRRNALRSTGPRTLAGKAKIRANAVKHGLAARTVKLAPGAVALQALLPANLCFEPEIMQGAQHIGARLARLDAYRQTMTMQAMLALQCADQQGDITTIIDGLVAMLRRLHRYERHLHARLKRLERGNKK
jgi:hypothetical protein